MLHLGTEDAKETVECLLDAKDVEHVRMSLEWLLRNEGIVSTRKIRGLLYRDIDQVRLYALS